MEQTTKSPAELAAEAKRVYAREWRKKNPEKAKQHLARYWARVGERMAQGKPLVNSDNSAKGE